MKDYWVTGMVQSITFSGEWTDISLIVNATFNGIQSAQLHTLQEDEDQLYYLNRLYSSYVVPMAFESFGEYHRRAINEIYSHTLFRFFRGTLNKKMVRLYFDLTDSLLDNEFCLSTEIMEHNLVTTAYATTDWTKDLESVISTVTDYLDEQQLPYLKGTLPLID